MDRPLDPVRQVLRDDNMRPRMVDANDRLARHHFSRERLENELPWILDA